MQGNSIFNVRSSYMYMLNIIYYLGVPEHALGGILGFGIDKPSELSDRGCCS